MIGLILVLLGMIGLFALITFVLYWYETANGAALEVLRRRSGNRTGHWVLQGFLWAVIAQTLAFLTFPLGLMPRRKDVPQGIRPSDPIVIAIHGLYHNRSAFVFLERALKRAGVRDVRMWGYSSWGTDFFTLGERLARDLETLHRDCPSRPILLVGHSLGGLLARCAAATVDPGTVAGCLTLGTPHQGSRLAVFAVGTLGRSLGYRSPLIEKIEQAENRRPRLRAPFLALASPVDNMVLPTEALVPATSHWQVQWTPPMSHVALLYHPAALKAVVSWVKTCTARPLSAEPAIAAAENTPMGAD